MAEERTLAAGGARVVLLFIAARLPGRREQALQHCAGVVGSDDVAGWREQARGLLRATYRGSGRSASR